MSRESHERFLKQAALREAQKAIERHGSDTIKKEDFHLLRIQTVERWKRIVLFVFGALICGLGVLAIREVAVWLGVLIFLGGIFCLGAALIGKKKTVVAALDGIDLLTLFEALF